MAVPLLDREIIVPREHTGWEIKLRQVKFADTPFTVSRFPGPDRTVTIE